MDSMAKASNDDKLKWANDTLSNLSIKIPLPISLVVKAYERYVQENGAEPNVTEPQSEAFLGLQDINLSNLSFVQMFGLQDTFSGAIVSHLENPRSNTAAFSSSSLARRRKAVSDARKRLNNLALLWYLTKDCVDNRPQGFKMLSRKITMNQSFELDHFRDMVIAMDKFHSDTGIFEDNTKDSWITQYHSIGVVTNSIPHLWKKKVFKKYQELLATGASTESAALWANNDALCKNIGLPEYGPYLEDKSFESLEALEWLSYGFDPEYANSWKKVGFSPAEASSLYEKGFHYPEEARKVSIASPAEWIEAW